VPNSEVSRTRDQFQTADFLPSFGSVGGCYDNSIMESCRSCVQIELFNRKGWKTWVELATVLFEYLEIFRDWPMRAIKFERRHRPTTGAWF
jgi:hypothetical protein